MSACRNERRFIAGFSFSEGKGAGHILGIMLVMQIRSGPEERDSGN